MQATAFRKAIELFALGSLVAVVLPFLLSTASAMPAPGDEGPADPAVVENTGSARYAIPIQVPPGPGGLVPDLALAYSSRQGDGPYGVGWDLALGEIACSLRFGVPDYAYSNCRQFELDGQLLIRDGVTHSYHAFVETFQQIEYLTGSQSWQVTNPNGTIRRYGLHADSRVMSGPDVARWLLSEIEDPFGNKIFFSYDDATDPGMRYPLRITYGAGATKAQGQRSVEFVFGEDRPDPIHDFAGAIERKVTKRLTDISVSSYGALVRRYAFGYGLSGLGYTTGRSRLSWSQIFGSDCAGDIGLCAGLPRQEFEYTDSHDDGATAPYSKRPKQWSYPTSLLTDTDPTNDPVDYSVPMAGNTWTNAIPVRIGDINGDGLPDLIKGGYVFSLAPEDTRVELNTGSGFVYDEDWTTAFNSLRVERPRADFTQIEVDCSEGGCGAVYHDPTAGTAGISTAAYTTTTVAHPVSAVLPAAMMRPRAEFSSGADFASGLPQAGWVEGIGRLFLTDVDGDGLADIVVSVRLAGASIVVDANGKPIDPASVSRGPDTFVHRVYRNTGDPLVGWDEDADLSAALASGLPPFGVVHFESGYGTEMRIPFGLATGGDIVDDVGSMAGLPQDPCVVRGLHGLTYSTVAGLFADVCLNYVNLDPRFHDFNGDGFVDLMVLELDDPDALYQGYMDRDDYTLYERGVDGDPLPDNHATSRVWIQNPDAAGTAADPRWVRAPEFDLPQVDFQAPENGGNWAWDGLFPLAHSQPVLQSPLTNLGTAQKCPAPQGMPPWYVCAPLSHNVNLGVNLADLNRDGLTDVIWSRYLAGGIWPNETRTLIAQGVLLNTGTGWCSSVPEMAVHVGGATCLDANVYYPPDNASPDAVDTKPGGFAFYDGEFTGVPTGYLADLNSDGFLDYVQAHTLQNRPGTAAWLFDPAAGANANRWVRDNRYDLSIDYVLINFEFADSAGFAVLDVNGDGAPDVVGDDLRADGITYPQAFISQPEHSDLLRLVRNGRGGEISIAYESAILQRDVAAQGLEERASEDASSIGEALDGALVADVIRWTPIAVVSQVRIAGPNRAPDPADPAEGFGPPSRYRYAHPRFCVKSRSDLGFRIVERTRPGGEVVTSAFYQLHGRAGRPSSVVVTEADLEMHRHEEDWEIQPAVPALVPGSIDHPAVHVGRLAETRDSNFYGAGTEGARLTRTFQYDDSYGYNFVEQTVETRPTGTLVNWRTPGTDPAHAIFGLVLEDKTFDHEFASPSSTDFLRHSIVAYDRGRPATVSEMLKARGASGAGTAELHTMEYDSYGNLTLQTISAAAGDQVTAFCYDGDGDSWCPDLPGQDSHSVRVGLRDNADGLTHFIPDPGTGTIVETDSTYTDEPPRRLELDRFGRPTESFVRDGTDWVRTSKTEYDDLAFQPSVATTLTYTRDGEPDADAIWSSVVFDGFGGHWKTISETPTGFVTTATFHDAGARTSRTILPVDCGLDAACGGIVGDTEPPATEVRADAIGRPIRLDTPHGFSIYDYSTVSSSAVSGPWPSSGSDFDVVVEKNGKGDLVQRGMDGDRLAWVDECENRVPATTTDLGGTTCTGSPLAQTFYAYEATGELRAIYDPRIDPAFSDPNHTLQYRYDTLGRVVQIDDPALGGSGHTLTTYDTFGNVHSTTNARLETRIHSYDALDRLTAIETPAGEADYAVHYRVGEKQAWQDRSSDYIRSRTFDGLGRVEEEHFGARDEQGFHFRSFFTTYSYDLTGRVTEVLHPAMHLEGRSIVDTIVRYKYDGAFLERICELGTADDCDSASLSFVSSMDFDSLGRRQSMTIPGGTRTFTYDSAHRLATDDFVSPTYRYTRNYEAYDEVGNVLAITGAEIQPVPLAVGHAYAYDERNRISSWSPEGSGLTYDFGYDDLGNLTLHAGDTQVYDDPSRPHAITRRDLTASIPTTYDYDDDGNVESIVGESGSSHFEYDSANQLVCLRSSASSSCHTRVAYDVNGKRVVEYLDGGKGINVYVGDAFLFEHAQAIDFANVEVMLDGERIALKRFEPRLRTSSARDFALWIPPTWLITGGTGCIAMLWLVCSLGRRPLVLVRLRPLRAATALSAAASLLLPSIVSAGAAPPTEGPPSYYWELSDPLGTGLVMFDLDGNRVRHQVFTPFGKIHAEIGADFRTFYAGHRRNERSGMFYMQARWYEPWSGRFLSSDPLLVTDSPQSHNPYSYVGNNPINKVDPTGRLGHESPPSSSMGDMRFDDGGQYGSGHPSGGTHSASLTRPSATSIETGGLSGDLGRSEFAVGSRGLDLAAGFSTAGIGGSGGGAAAASGFGPSVGLGGFGGFGQSLGGLSSLQSSSSNLAAAGIVFVGGGATAGLGEYSNVMGGRWRAQSTLKDGTRPWYAASFNGNGATGGRSAVLARAVGWRSVSRLFFGLGAAVSAGQGFSGELSAERAGTDIVMSGVGTYLGPIGLAAAGTYFGSNLAVDFLGLDRAAMRAAGPKPSKY